MLSIDPEVVWVDSDDEVRLYHPGTGEFQTLNASAAQIWRRLAAGATVEQIVHGLAEQFEAQDEHDRSTIDADVRAFVATLRTGGLLAEPDAEPAR